MFAVGLVTLATSTEEEAPALAGDLGMTAYDARLLLARGVPCIVLRSSEKDRAVTVLKRLRARGHQAVAFDTGAVTARSQMTRPRALRFESGGLCAEAGQLPYDEVVVLIHGTRPTRDETVHTTTHRQFDLKGAVVTGGLKLTKKVTKQHSLVIEDREQFLLVYPRPPSPPWTLEESALHYHCLGAEMTTNRMENLRKVVDRVRQLAPHAQFDDSLLRFAKAGHDKLGEQAIDEQAHLIALCAAKGLLAHSEHHRR